jgi:thiosulfate/3-mercaptopyruvate sulfurtransferase
MEAVITILLLLNTEELAGRLGQVQVVDARPLDAYTEGHIPGALHLDADALSAEQRGVTGLLRPLEELGPLLSRAGLDPTRPVAVYSQMDSPAECRRAARLFWAFEYLSFRQVSILDGGFAKWRAESRPVEAGAPPVSASPDTEHVFRPRPELLATRTNVLDLIREGRGVLADMRAPEEYVGLSKRDFVARSGHIPGAENVPIDTLLDAHGEGDAVYYMFKQGDALTEALAGDRSRQVITYCTTGTSGSVGYFAYRLAGHNWISLYDGSMAEWGNHPGLQVSGEQ